MSHSIQTMEHVLHSVDPFESLEMCPILDDLLPLDEVFLESLIQSNLLLDVGSVVTKSNPNLPSNPDLYSYVGLVESVDSSFEQQVSDSDEFDFSYEFFNSCDTEFVPTDCISLVDFFSSYEVDLIDYKPSGLGTIESSLVDSSLTTPFVEDSKVACVSAKVTCIESFLLNMILMLLFLGDMIFSLIHNYLLAPFYCSSCNYICMYPSHTYEPNLSFHSFSSLYNPSSMLSSSLTLVPFWWSKNGEK